MEALIVSKDFSKSYSEGLQLVAFLPTISSLGTTRVSLQITFIVKQNSESDYEFQQWKLSFKSNEDQ